MLHLLSIVTVSLIILPATCLAKSEVETTPTGIAIDTLWKKQVYEFAKKHAIHPAWGIAHSERDFQVSKAIASQEGITLDEDVLFAAAFLHDIGGIAPYTKPKVDHPVRSVEVIEPLLPTWGFPIAKWPMVKEMILGHTYYGRAPATLPAQVFRDADILDFLGSIGIARILAVTEEAGFANGTLTPTVATLRNFAKTLPDKCSTKTCKKMAKPRLLELKEFLKTLDNETFQGKSL